MESGAHSGNRKNVVDMPIETLEKPANPERKDEKKTIDEELMGMMTDRSQKFDAKYYF